jgi:hypothetical protein
MFSPPLSISLSQKLFRQSLTEGVITCSTAPNSYISVAIVSPSPFNDTGLPYVSNSGPGSRTGFSKGAWFTSYEVTLADVRPTIKTECGIAFSELALQLKLGLELGLRGLAGMFTGMWQSGPNLLSAAVGVSPGGVLVRLE